MANPTIQPYRQAGCKPFYIVLFETIADRSRWLSHNGFSFDSLEHATARWTCTHNGSDFTRWLEMVPYALEHSCNPRALCMRVYLHEYNPKPKPKARHEAKPKRASVRSHSSPKLAKNELD